MFDCNSFLNRKGWKQRELAQRLNIGTSTVGMWCTGKSTPSYDVIVKLFKLGVTMEELFGEEIGKLVKNHYLSSLGNSEFHEGLDFGNKPITKNEALALIKDLKEKGII